MSHESIHEMLPLYALGILDAEEILRVDRHLDTGCDSCRRELDDHERAVAALAYTVTAVAPPAALRERILAAARDSGANATVQTWKTWIAAPHRPDLELVRAQDGVWEPVLEGITVKRLALDPERRTVTMLVRMLAGSRYPAHRHAQGEECLVLEGELHVGDDLVMRAGDFQRASRDSTHRPQSTTTGCLLLVTSSLDDELL